ncbi:MAG: bifunctional nuclease family protein [Bacteroidota bacterium]
MKAAFFNTILLMDKIRLEVIGISYSQTQSGTYALVLEDNVNKKQLPILIGHAEAQSIAIAMENIKPPRPLAHDLFKSFANAFSINIIEVVINKLVDGVFYSKLVCTNGKKNVEIDARTSDAIALALRFECPIYANASVMEAARSIENETFETTDEKDEEHEEMEPNEISITDYESFTNEELDEMLKLAISDEDYEKASKIRDEIKKRKHS